MRELFVNLAMVVKKLLNRSQKPIQTSPLDRSLDRRTYLGVQAQCAEKDREVSKRDVIMGLAHRVSLIAVS